MIYSNKRESPIPVTPTQETIVATSSVCTKSTQVMKAGGEAVSYNLISVILRKIRKRKASCNSARFENEFCAGVCAIYQCLKIFGPYSHSLTYFIDLLLLYLL